MTQWYCGEKCRHGLMVKTNCVRCQRSRSVAGGGSNGSVEEGLMAKACLIKWILSLCSRKEEPRCRGRRGASGRTPGGEGSGEGHKCDRRESRGRPGGTGR